MSELREPNTNDITKTLLPQTGEQAYALIESTYGLPLKATTFGGALQGKRGTIAPLACLLMEWCLDWYRPCETGKRYRGDVPYLDSAGLARDWHASTKAFKLARETVSHAGLVVFEKRRHDCLVHIQWDAVAEAVRREAEFRGCKSAQSDDFRQSLKGPSKSRQSLKGPSKRFRQSLKGPSKPLDSPYRDHTLLLRSSPIPSPPVEEEGETRGETLEAMFVEMITHGRKAGRSCDTRWLQESRDAFYGVVADGRDPNLVKAAWYEYVDKKGKGATYLGHWVKGLNLRGEKADEDEWAFVACYERLEHAAELRAERERVAAGGVPKPKLEHTSVGWVELVSGLVLEGVDKDATAEEAEEAWPEFWRQTQAS